MSGILYIVATPIGNLADITERAKEILAQVDFILAEDTRVTLGLLRHLGISKKLFSYSEHSSEQKEQAILDNLMSGQNYALVSDAGTPAVSDPGSQLVAKAIENDITVVPIPGPSAVSAILSVCGFVHNAHHFWGFFPQKKIRQSELLEFFRTVPGVHVFFESPFRIEKTLRDCFGDTADFEMVMGRELTKKFETIYRGSPQNVLEQLKGDTIKGEFVVALKIKQ